MNRTIVVVGLLTSVVGVPRSADAQAIDSPQTRMRPIGSPSIVDRYGHDLTPTQADQRWRETSSRPQTSVQPAAWMQNFEVPPLPSGGGPLQPGTPQDGTFNPPPMTLPPSSSTPTPLPQNSVTQTPVPQASGPQNPRTLPANPNAAGDYAPLSQPSLGNQFATLGNSCHVTGPSTYTAASASGCCTPVNYQAPPAYVAPPAPVAGPASVPPAVVAPGAPIGAAPTGNGVPRGALISFGQERYPVQVGPGLFGQPVAYVPGQKFRNWIRYIFP